MLKRWKTWAGTLLLAGTLAIQMGCVRARQIVTLMPDGSGKIEIAIGLGDQLMKMAEADKNGGPGALPGGPGGPPGGEGGDDFIKAFKEAGDLNEWNNKTKGIVAIGTPVTQKKDGWTEINISLYFDDINQVQIEDDEKEQDGLPKKKVTTFALKKEGGQSVLEVLRPMLSDMQKPGAPGGDDPAAANDPMAQQMMAMMKAMFAGLEISEVYNLPGKITKVEGLPAAEGNSVKLRVTADELFDPAKSKETQKIATSDKRVITFGASDLPAAEVAAFKAELAKAKAEWAKIQADLKKKAE